MALFRRKHVELILQGRKTQTRRIHSHEWKLGRIYGVRDKLFGKPLAHIMVIRKFRQKLGEESAAVAVTWRRLTGKSASAVAEASTTGKAS